MDEETMLKIEKHLGKPYEITLTRNDGTPDLFQIQQLDWDYMPKLMRMVSVFQDNIIETEYDDNGETKVRVDINIAKLTQEDFKIMQEVVQKSVLDSYPELFKDKPQMLNKFCMTNFQKLLEGVLECNKGAYINEQRNTKIDEKLE